MNKTNNMLSVWTVVIAGTLASYSAPFAPKLNAEPLYMDNAVTFLYSSGYELPKSDGAIATLQHYSLWGFGDVFAFWDLMSFNPDGPAKADFSWYGEVSPRFSFNKISGSEMSTGFVKDVLVAFNFEHGQAGKAVQSLNMGVGFDLNVPGFQFVELDVYGRMPRLKENFNDVQVTIAWAKPFKLGGESFLFGGFCDFVLGVGDLHHQTICQPQVHWHVGKYLGLTHEKISVGFEMAYWEDKYRIPSSDAVDSDQVALNAMLQVHF